MTISIDKVFTDSFEDTVRHLAQQRSNKLRGWTMERATSTSSHAWDRLGAAAMVQKTSARTATPVVDNAWSRRVSVPQTWHVADTVEPGDIKQMLIDPKSALAMSFAMAASRNVDDIIIAAATGNALDGAGSPVSFPGGQEIGDYTGEISFDVLTAIQEKFMVNDIDPEEPKVAVVGPKQVRKLMQMTEATSADFVQAQALQRYGIVPNWMGFTWVATNRLLAPNTDQLDCLFFTQRAIGLQVNAEPWVRVAEDPTKSFNWVVYLEQMFGAVRVEDEHIVRFKAADTV